MPRLLLFLSFILSTVTASAQVLKGRVTDETGNPIPFAKVRVMNTSYGTVANALGSFHLELSFASYEIQFSAIDFITRTDTITLTGDVVVEIVLQPEANELEETVITARTKRDLAKEIMKQVIDKRTYFRDLVPQYSCNTYCFTSLEKEMTDSLKTDSIISRQNMNLNEWNGTSYYKAANRYKDVITAYTDLVEYEGEESSATLVIDGTEEDLLDVGTYNPTDPYVFVNSIKDADINLFDNLIHAPGLSQRPIISPLAYNAFVYYSFSVVSSFYDEDLRKIYEIKVNPRFSQEALFDGTLFIRDSVWELVSYELGVNKGALNFFSEMRLICDYEKMDERLIPTRREFVYLIKEGKTKIHGKCRLLHSDYTFDYDDSDNKFWLETTIYTPEAFDRDTTYWNKIRPFHLKPEEILFMQQQDSIETYHASEEYLKKQDSTYNTLTVWDFLFNGVGFRNTFKKQEIQFSSLIEQVVPFGVGGYRHRFAVDYDKGFKNNHQLSLNPMIDYGFLNKDVKGQIGVEYLYNPRKFSKIFIEAGDVYDFMNGYQSIQGTFAPANRVRNRKFEFYHRMELINGLYFKAGFFYSNRSSIDQVKYPEWVDAFGYFSKPEPFEGYKIFMTDFEFSYHFRQKYMLKGNKKIIVGSQWPVLSLKYKKGWPTIFGGQSNFDFAELKLTDEINLNSLGNSEYLLVAGAFLRKKDLRLVEHKFFRTSDRGFFSNPVNSMQLLDTNLNTSNSYLQFNGIHHFNGFFLNKIWLLNRLKLSETVGGGLLIIPDANFALAEAYVGIERTCRIKKQQFRIGVYAVSAVNSYGTGDVQFKVGINFYDSFRRKWDY